MVLLMDWASFIYSVKCCSEKICCYVLQEDAISEQLFQSSDNALDDLVWTADSMFTSLKVAVTYGFFIVQLSSGNGT
jgi:nuclear pore complex protein Nup160